MGEFWHEKGAMLRGTLRIVMVVVIVAQTSGLVSTLEKRFFHKDASCILYIYYGACHALERLSQT